MRVGLIKADIIIISSIVTRHDEADNMLIWR